MVPWEEEEDDEDSTLIIFDGIQTHSGLFPIISPYNQQEWPPEEKNKYN